MGQTSPPSVHWARELRVIGPGLSEAVQWAGLVVEKASGTDVWDTDGRHYVDLMGAGGVNLIGHSHPTYVTALTEQLSAWMIGAHASMARLEMTERLAAVLPSHLERVQLYSGGSEAVEASLRLARSVTGRFEVLSFWRAFHGRTMGSLALTSGGRVSLGPMPPGAISAPYADCFRCPLRLRFPSCGLACVELAHDIIREQSGGALGAIIVEPVQGRAGNVVPPPGYLAALRQLADEHSALLIVDESMTGMGRTGAILASTQPDVRPDVVVLGKGLGNGYPVSAIAAPAALMAAEPFGAPSASSSSYGGFPMACRAVSAVVQVLQDESLVERSRQLGQLALDMLRDRLADRPLIGEVRGAGLAIGIELVNEQHTRQPLAKVAIRAIFDDLVRAGVLVMTGGSSLRLYPPLTTQAEQLLSAVEVIAAILARHEPRR